MTRSFGMLAVLLTMLGAGCGKELLAGGFTGNVDAVATDRGGAQGERAASSAREPRPAGQLVGLQGTLEMTAAMALVRDDGTVVPLTGPAVPVQMRLAASDEVRLDGREVLVGRYTAVRLTFSRVEANVTAGTGVGGVQIDGRVAVGIGAEPLVVEKEIELRVERDGEHRVEMDLNSAAWLTAAGPGGIVPAATFQSAVRVSAR